MREVPRYITEAIERDGENRVVIIDYDFEHNTYHGNKIEEVWWKQGSRITIEGYRAIRGYVEFRDGHAYVTPTGQGRTELHVPWEGIHDII